MKVYLYYYEFNLGYLTETSNGYLWTPNLSGIEGAKEKFELGMEMFFLPEFEQEFDHIPSHFKEYLNEREDLVYEAKILPTDSTFEKLYKMSKLNYFIQEFVIKS